MKEPNSRRDAAVERSSAALAGEDLEYFARYKLAVVKRILGRKFSGSVLDFGCGTGDVTRLLAQTYDVVHGYDPSTYNLDVAKKRAPLAELFDDPASLPRGHYGAIVLAGVLRHVPPENRPGLVRTVVQLLAIGGKAIVFEHNAIHPVMKRVVRNAEGIDIHIPPRAEIKRLLKDAKLSRIASDYIVFFPRSLSLLRPLEPLLARVPAGAQVVVHGEKR